MIVDPRFTRNTSAPTPEPSEPSVEIAYLGNLVSRPLLRSDTCYSLSDIASLKQPSLDTAVTTSMPMVDCPAFDQGLCMRSVPVSLPPTHANQVLPREDRSAHNESGLNTSYVSLDSYMLLSETQSVESASELRELMTADYDPSDHEI